MHYFRNRYWRSNNDWWHRDENMNEVINDDAPQEAKESYERYLKELKEVIERRTL